MPLEGLAEELQLYDSGLRPLSSSPWIGQEATGPYRRKGTVQRVYPSPYGAEVAVLTHGPAPFTRVEFQVTDLLSTPSIPAAQRTTFLANAPC